mmetsp:Transcript_3725/g.6467  ORF Transcript_3725/g.6467 Transcript_3725/m.6467 type:complete len:249 (-) Transcript_3725:278-1024(-)
MVSKPEESVISHVAVDLNATETTSNSVTASSFVATMGNSPSSDHANRPLPLPFNPLPPSNPPSLSNPPPPPNTLSKNAPFLMTANRLPSPSPSPSTFPTSTPPSLLPPATAPTARGKILSTFFTWLKSGNGSLAEGVVAENGSASSGVVMSQANALNSSSAFISNHHRRTSQMQMGISNNISNNTSSFNSSSNNRSNHNNSSNNMVTAVNTTTTTTATATATATTTIIVTVLSPPPTVIGTLRIMVIW